MTWQMVRHNRALKDHIHNPRTLNRSLSQSLALEPHTVNKPKDRLVTHNCDRLSRLPIESGIVPFKLLLYRNLHMEVVNETSKRIDYNTACVNTSCINHGPRITDHGPYHRMCQHLIDRIMRNDASNGMIHSCAQDHINS